jgi:TolA-binding protein
MSSSNKITSEQLTQQLQALAQQLQMVWEQEEKEKQEAEERARKEAEVEERRKVAEKKAAEKKAKEERKAAEAHAAALAEVRRGKARDPGPGPSKKRPRMPSSEDLYEVSFLSPFSFVY